MTTIRCTRCVLPSTFPGIRFDAEGRCSVCAQSPSPERSELRRAALRQRFEDLVARTRGNGRYDVLVAYSGGKDSSYTLTLLAKEMGLSILAVSVDNGFFTESVHRNMQCVVEALGVDHEIVRPPEDLLRPLFAATAQRDVFAPSTLVRASSVCTACMAIVKFTCLRRAIEDRIPLVGYGWSPGQSPLSSALYHPTPDMLGKMQEVLHDPITTVVGDRADTYFLRDEHLADPDAIPHLVSPLAMFDYDEGVILRTLSTLGWQPPQGMDANTTNCRLNALANQAHQERHQYHPYAFELAGLVREGILTRDEAIRRLEEPMDPHTLDAVRRELGLPVGK